VRNFKDKAICKDMDFNLFFDRYEEDHNVAKKIDLLCVRCPVQRDCLAHGVSNAEWGVWGGVYLQDGKISKEFNTHKSKEDWFDIWSSATMEKN
jgi:hypothetical protein